MLYRLYCRVVAHLILQCEKIYTVKNQQNKFKYAPRIEPNNYKYVSYFRPVAR